MYEFESRILNLKDNNLSFIDKGGKKLTKQRMILIIITILVVLGIQLDSLAFDLQTNIKQQSLQEGEIKIFLKISDLQDYSDGINVVSGKLVYDTNLFECVSFTGMNNWSCAYNNEEENESQGKFMLITTAGNVTEEKEVAQIELRLKTKVAQQEAKVKFEEIQTSYHAEKIETEDKVFNLKVEGNNIEIVQNDNEKTEVIQDIKETEEKQNKNTNDHVYILIAIMVIMLVILVILMIKLKERGRTNEK